MSSIFTKRRNFPLLLSVHSNKGLRQTSPEHPPLTHTPTLWLAVPIRLLSWWYKETRVQRNLWTCCSKEDGILGVCTVNVHLVDDFYFFPFTFLGVFSLPDREFYHPYYLLGASQGLPVWHGKVQCWAMRLSKQICLWEFFSGPGENERKAQLDAGRGKLLR